MLEKGRFPSQTLPNPRGVHELSFPSEPAQKMDEVQAIITLRSGKEIEQPGPKPASKTKEKEELEPEHIIINEDSMKKSMPQPPPPPPPFPQALRGKKKSSKKEGILEVLRQVKENIPLLDMIKQVPTYAKFLKDLCTIKKGLGINKKAFLTEQVSSIIQCKTLLKYKDPGSPTISVNIGRDLHRQGTAEFGSQCQPTAIINVRVVRFGGAEAYQHHSILSRSISENT